MSEKGMIWVERDFDTNTLRVSMLNGLGRKAPLRNQYGLIVDFDFEVRMAGSAVGLDALYDRLQRADAAFRNWDLHKNSG